MEPTLTEFSYGYCVTEELANGTGERLMAAPYFPSLYAEGRPGGGFDVRIGTAVFLQFKVSEELTRRTTVETKRGLLEPTFFRFWLHRKDRSEQHQMLIELESEPGNQVYYIAPAFANVSDLDEAYNNRLVVNRSAMFSPKEIGPLADASYHRVSFRPDQDWGWFLSDPKRVPMHQKSEALKRSSAHKFWTEGTAELDDWLHVVVERMRKIIQANRPRQGRSYGGDATAPSQNPLRSLDTVAYLARTHFGCELFLSTAPR